MDCPSFSIIVPTYQRRDVVCDTVRALCGIKYDGEAEIIVAVDGSTDGSAAAVARLECPIPLRVIEQPNRGASAARNRASAEATGEILLFLDDDMICEADVLEAHARSYREGADAVLGDFVEPGSTVGYLSEVMATRKSSARGQPALTPFDIFSGHLSVRRRTFEMLGGFDESFRGNGDYGDSDLGQRLLQSFVVRHNPLARSHHRNFVGPRDYIRRGRNCADATLYFAAKHPELKRELIEWTGASRISSRLRLLSRIPIFPWVFAEIAAWVAEIGFRTPFRASPKLMYLRNAAYVLTYWSTIQRNGGFPRL